MHDMYLLARTGTTALVCGCSGHLSPWGTSRASPESVAVLGVSIGFSPRQQTQRGTSSSVVSTEELLAVWSTHADSKALHLAQTGGGNAAFAAIRPA
jgi:hypothetical protein